MSRIIPALLALFVATSAVCAQDFLQSLERLAEEVLPQQSAAPQRVEPTTPSPVEARPAAEADEVVVPPLPRPRPDVAPAVEPPQDQAPDESADRVYQTACPALLSGVVVGEMVEPIEDGMCGERSPLVVTALRVNGREIGFSSPVTTNCQMATALADWVGEVDAYAKAALESPVTGLTSGTSMMCRNRYSAEDGFVSEHGFANALDVTGFTLADGRSISVAADWLKASSVEGKLLRQAHGAACGRFTTVLGPEANADHQDHFHLDLGYHGQTCMAQICE